QLEKFQDDKIKEVNEKFDKLSADFVEMAIHLEEEKFQDDKMKEVNEKFDKLSADFVEIALHLEEKIYPHLLTTIFWTSVAAYQWHRTCYCHMFKL
ncbi:hypothetical protein Tco_1397081, partial [Tanacetum coccineum]